MKPLSQNLTNNNKINSLNKEKKVKILDNKEQAAKIAGKMVTNEEFINFIENIQTKYHPYSEKINKSNHGNLNQQSNQVSMQNKNKVFNKDNNNNNVPVNYTEIEEDYEEDFESDYVDNIINKSAKNSVQAIKLEEQANSKISSKDNVKINETKMDKIVDRNYENSNDNTYKGYYPNFKKFNDNPNLYFKYKSKENTQQRQKGKLNKDKKIENKQNPSNSQQKQQQQSSSTTNIQGVRISSLPSNITQNQQKKYKQQLFNNYQDQKEELDLQNRTNFLRSKYTTNTGYESFNKFPLEQSPIIGNIQAAVPQQIDNNNSSSGNNNNNNYQQQNQFNKYRIRKPLSATVGQKTKQNFFKNIQKNLNKNINESSPQRVKNNNMLINDIFNISDHDVESKNAMESTLYFEIQNSKVQKNQFIQENHQIREKIVNVKKDIKQMSKQLQKWSIESRMVFDEEEEPYLDAYCCDKVYDDQNFYLITLRQRVNDMKNQISELDESIKVYNQALRSIRTDINSDQVKIEMEKQFMLEYSLYREAFEEKNNENNFQFKQYQKYHKKKEVQELVRLKDYYEQQIRKFKDDNKVILVEISLQQEIQEENNIEISKLEKISKQRQDKTEKIKEELKQRSPEDLQQKKNILKQKTIKMEEEKKNRNAEQQQSLIHIQYEKLNQLKFDFQEFRRKQILENQESVRFNTDLKTLIDKLKEDYVKIQSQIVKKKKLIKKQLIKSNDARFKVEFQQGQPNLYLQEDYQIIDDYDQDFEDEQSNKNIEQIQLVKKTSSFNSANHSKKPSQVSLKGQENLNSLQQLQNIQSFQNPSSLPQSLAQSLCSTDQGNYGESQKSQYNNDDPISIIYGVQTIEV